MISHKNCSKKTDEQLVELTIKNQEHYGCLIQKYEDKLLRFIMRISNVQIEEAEDILQDAFIKAYINLNDFDTSLKFSSWIYRITRNTTISAHRKKMSRPQTINSQDAEHFLEHIEYEHDIIKEIDHSIQANQIKKIIQKIDQKYKEVLILKFLEDKTYKEISDILKKPINTVGTLINRAKAAFKKEYEKHYQANA